MNLDFLKMGILSGISKHEGIKQQRKLAYLKIIPITQTIFQILKTKQLA